MADTIKNIYISNYDFWPITFQSCDCFALIIDYGDKLEMYQHREHVDDGAIEVEIIDSFDAALFSVQVNLENEQFVLDKKLFKDDGALDAVRFKFEDVFLFVFASEYGLILTKSKYDIFEDQPMPFPEKEAVLSFIFCKNIDEDYISMKYPPEAIR